ncbi:MAG: hypothetical protein FJX18_00045 [Alphaproteobacteria bacterium]|nr:hypothetical protein [Alphaproteobacteria bacterium]
MKFVCVFFSCAILLKECCFADTKTILEQEVVLEEILDKLLKKKKDSHIDYLRSFKEILFAYRKKHVEGVFAQDNQCPGTIVRESSYYTQSCIIKKQTKDIRFLSGHSIPTDVRIWLEDAEQDLWKELEPILSHEDYLSKSMTYIKKKLMFEKVLERRQEFYWDSCYDLARRNKIKFSKEEISFLKALDEQISEAFLKVLSLYKTAPISMRLILEDHSVWLSYRLYLLLIGEHLGVDGDLLKLRLICLGLARLYFYKRFFAYFDPEKSVEQYAVLPPREYAEICEYDYTRKLKGLPLSEPCYPS